MLTHWPLAHSLTDPLYHSLIGPPIHSLDTTLAIHCLVTTSLQLEELDQDVKTIL